MIFKTRSGTGWPSFFDYYKGSIETKIDYKLIYPRVEYRCAVCEGHHGHVFNDGPKPTFKRYCNKWKSIKIYTFNLIFSHFIDVNTCSNQNDCKYYRLILNYNIN